MARIKPTIQHKTLQKVWYQMIQRCENPQERSYRSYGARGITVCPAWHTFAPFFAWAMTHGYCKGLVLDRIDVDGPYAPENCRFVTNKENQNNKRSNHYVSWNGLTRTIAEWSSMTGISKHTIWDRLVLYHWTPERTLTATEDQRYGVQVSYNGACHYLFEWGEILGIKPATLRYRLRAGWSVEKTLSTPVDTKKRNHYGS